MPDGALQQLRDQAERSEPEVRAAALLHFSRVESVIDPGRAVRTFDDAVTAIRRLTDEHGEWLAGHARLIAAAVVSERIAGIAAEGRIGFHINSDLVVRTMVEHAHSDAAISYVLGYDHNSTFPL